MSQRIHPNFSRSEFACKCGCGFDTVDTELLRVLVNVRHDFQRKYPGYGIEITGPNRCEKHNKAVGGSERSQHLLAKAADFKVKNFSTGHCVPADEVADHLEKKYNGKYGIGRYTNRTHLDVRDECARWDAR